MQMIDEHRLKLRNTIAIGIAQKGDAVSALRAGACAGLDLALDIILGPEGLGAGTVALDHENVAVGEGIDDARMHEAAGHRLDPQAGWNRRGLARFPADRLGHAHRRKQILRWLREPRVRSILPHRVTALVGARTQRTGGEDQRRQCAREADRPRAHGRDSRWRTDARGAVTVEPRMPATSSSTVTMADRVMPVGTTDVQASRVWTRTLTIERTVATASRMKSGQRIGPARPNATSARRMIADTSASTRPPVISHPEKFDHCIRPLLEYMKSVNSAAISSVPPSEMKKGCTSFASFSVAAPVMGSSCHLERPSSLEPGLGRQRHNGFDASWCSRQPTRCSGLTSYSPAIFGGPSSAWS